ncbi:MAG: hypothetical protein K6G26_03160 [Lachnospiraceae bacterium]|nr:hypothetical protein [Lachnospiraceae bacterium]
MKQLIYALDLSRVYLKDLKIFFTTVTDAVETIFKQKFVDVSEAERAENIGYVIVMLVIILE